ncbi:hypothetical protein HY346_01750 [Candidatus Microgenomates bacterium]|nr:hypothetical protein [Candidatus Microgenomates bacterium]
MRQPTDTNVFPLFADSEEVPAAEAFADSGVEIPGLLGRAWVLGHEVIQLARDTTGHVKEKLWPDSKLPPWFREAVANPLQIYGERIIKIDPRNGEAPSRIVRVFPTWADRLGEGFGQQLLWELASSSRLTDTTLLAMSNDHLRSGYSNFDTASEIDLAVRDKLQSLYPELRDVAEVVVGGSMGANRAQAHAAKTRVRHLIEVGPPLKTDYISLVSWLGHEALALAKRLAMAPPREWPLLAGQIYNVLPRPSDIGPMVHQVQLMHEQPLQQAMTVPDAIPADTRITLMIGIDDIISNDPAYWHYVYNHPNGQILAYDASHMGFTHVDDVGRQLARVIVSGDQPLKPENKVILVGSAKSKVALARWLSGPGIRLPSQTPGSRQPSAS